MGAVGWTAALVAACSAAAQQTGARLTSRIELERHGPPLSREGPDSAALPFEDRFRYGAVVGTVLTAAGERGCRGEVWLQPEGTPLIDARAVDAARLGNMFRFPQLPAGRYVLGARCLGYAPVRRTVRVTRGVVVRAVVTMAPRSAAVGS
jgi:hypothetical protein